MRYKIAIFLIALAGAFGLDAYAQYYQIANQIQNAVMPALSGSFNYKGFVEGEYLHAVGDYNADFASISTVQGFRYSSWFFMGAGLGVQYVHTNTPADWGQDFRPGYGDYDSSQNGLMVPLFTDFRFNVGKPQGIGLFIDLRVGASFLMTDDYLRIGNGYITDREYFYLRPSIGLRIPTNPQNSSQAVNVGFSYQLLTGNYWYAMTNNTSINAIGVNISYEW